MKNIAYILSLSNPFFNSKLRNPVFVIMITVTLEIKTKTGTQISCKIKKNLHKNDSLSDWALFIFSRSSVNLSNLSQSSLYITRNIRGMQTPTIP